MPRPPATFWMALQCRLLPGWSGFGKGRDTRCEQVPQLSLLGRVEPPAHLVLHRTDSGAGGFQPLPTQRGEPDGEDPAGRWLLRPGDEPIAFERLQEDVHRLSGYEGAPGQIGAGKTGPLGEELKARVLWHGHPQRAQGTVHCGPQCTVRLLKEIAQRGVQVHSGTVLTHVSILT